MAKTRKLILMNRFYGLLAQLAQLLQGALMGPRLWK